MSIIKRVNLEFFKSIGDKNGRSQTYCPNWSFRWLVTEQLPPTKSGFVGYKTTYSEKQKEAKYETPKAP